MEALVIVIAIVAAFVMLGLGAIEWGADSRDLRLDDHRR